MYRHVLDFTVFFFLFSFFQSVSVLKLYLPPSANNVDESKLYQRSKDEGSASHEPHFTGHNVRHSGRCTAGLAWQGDEGQNGANTWQQGALIGADCV